MKTKYIRITGINDLADFIKHSSSVDGDVLVTKGRYIVDGKSIMGMMSIDITTGKTKIEYPEKAKDFDVYLERYEV